MDVKMLLCLELVGGGCEGTVVSRASRWWI